MTVPSEKSNDKKLLLITFFFPPLAGAGTQRALKFAKYLPLFHWIPVILTSNSTDYHVIDENSVKEPDVRSLKIIRTSIAELSGIYEWLYKFRLNKLALKLRNWESAFKIPDRRIGWLPFAFWRGFKLIKQKRINAIYSTSAPFTSHLIGYLLKKSTGVPWIADFRDEWTDTPYFNYSYFERSINRGLEKLVLKSADKVIAVNDAISDLLKVKLPCSDRHKFTTIPNGFDEDEIQEAISSQKNQRNKFIITHAGSLYATRKPDVFLKAISRLIHERSIEKDKIEIRFIGSSADAELIKSLNLENIVNNSYGFVSHRQALKLMAESSILLLIVRKEGAKQVTTSKIFEYMALCKPILALGANDTQVEKIIRKTNSGYVTDSDINSLREIILKLYGVWVRNEDFQKPNMQEINKYNRREIANQLSFELNKLTVSSD